QEPGYIVTNPPYGERLGGQADEFWQEWSAHLKTHYDGWNINVISSDLELPGHLRLRPERRFPVFNGALDCRLFQFHIRGRQPETASAICAYANQPPSPSWSLATICVHDLRGHAPFWPGLSGRIAFRCRHG